MLAQKFSDENIYELSKLMNGEYVYVRTYLNAGWANLHIRKNPRNQYRIRILSSDGKLERGVNIIGAQLTLPEMTQ